MDTYDKSSKITFTKHSWEVLVESLESNLLEDKYCISLVGSIERQRQAFLSSTPVGLAKVGLELHGTALEFQGGIHP